MDPIEGLIGSVGTVFWGLGGAMVGLALRGKRRSLLFPAAGFFLGMKLGTLAAKSGSPTVASIINQGAAAPTLIAGN